jgi:MinD-like ATPase involved in chromosome partitioning or flagellar assembly
MTFDQVLPELIRLCEDDTALRNVVARYCIIRDVRGRVRLVVGAAAEATPALAALEAALRQALGEYFAPPIICDRTGDELARLARTLLERSSGQWPAGWPRSVQNILGAGETAIEIPARWTGIDRTIGKEAWLASTVPAPPWPLVEGKTPPIVTFHSFKGGVGRTTLVAAFAVRLASRNPPVRVAVVDLDLEAPGIGSLLGVKTARGVIDVLVDHIATGRLDLDASFAPAQLESPLAENLTVFPAGQLDAAYMQKLARLDFSSSEPGASNPVGLALTAMLRKIKADHDVIVLDSRAGLHDLAGMSLHGLAHVDVLVFRGTDQNLVGLAQTLRTLGSHEAAKIVLVETMLPANDDELFSSRREKTRSRVYDFLCDYIYPDDDPPQLGDIGETHDVVSVRRRDWLGGLDSVGGHVVEILQDSDLALVSQRICDACGLDAEGAAPDDEAV